MIDPKRIHFNKLANPLRVHFVRWEAYSHSWTEGFDALFSCVGSMEIV